MGSAVFFALDTNNTMSLIQENTNRSKFLPSIVVPELLKLDYYKVESHFHQGPLYRTTAETTVLQGWYARQMLDVLCQTLVKQTVGSVPGLLE